MTAVGSDRVLIGAYLDDAGAQDAGAAYLFSTNGSLMQTFTNPAPTVGANFGTTVAAVGSDRVLIGALYETTDSIKAGAAYLFDLQGRLLATFTSPNPTANDLFGYALSAPGGNRILVGAHYDGTTGPYAGAVYMFETNGSLASSLTSPSPTNDKAFGFSLASDGNARILIGAVGMVPGSGRAYLYSFSGENAPLLTIRLLSPNAAVLSWPSPSEGFQLEQSTDSLMGAWETVTEGVEDDGTNKTLQIFPLFDNRYYRLLKP